METENGAKASNIVILYEDDVVCVINKPVGMMVHDDGRSGGETVVDWFLVHAPKTRGVGEPGFAQNGAPLERSGVVHRLDRDTSGVLILAKTQDAFIHLKEQFHGRYARKEYRAFVHGAMKEKWGTIKRPIGRSTKDFRLRSAERGARGLIRPARTDWEVLAQGGSVAYLRVLPKTGRTHQIRVHMKAIGRPIIGDTLYMTKEWEGKEGLGFTRLALHAYSLTLTLPNSEEMTFTAPLPPEFIAGERAIAMA